MEKLYTCGQVAERYGVKTETIWAWIREQRLSAIRVSNRYRVRESDLLEFEQSKKTTNAENKG